MMNESALSCQNGTGKFSNFYLIVRPDPCDEIDDKRNICPSMRFFDMTPQSLNLNIRFLNYWLFGHSEFLL